MVVIIRGADKSIIGDIKFIEQIPEMARHFICQFARSHPQIARLLRHFQAMLIRPRLKTNLAPHQPLETGNDIGSNRFIGMADMWLAIGVVDCGGNVIRISHWLAR